MDIKVLIALHKPYRIPMDEMYVPVHVGANNAPMFFRTGDRIVSEEEMYDFEDEESTLFYPVFEDDEGENISEKNPYYSELTGLYYAYKNWDFDALGLVHYRRYFKSLKRNAFKLDPLQNVLSLEEADELLRAHDVIVPKRRNYYIESLYSHYAHTFDNMHLLYAAKVIKDIRPKYFPYVSPAFNSKEGFMFNMFIMKSDLMKSYFDFLFPVLFELEKRLEADGIVDMDTEGKSESEKREMAFKNRLYGRVSEILFNVWFIKEAPTFTEIPVLETERTNWIKKGSSFLSAKFLGTKYKESF